MKVVNVTATVFLEWHACLCKKVLLGRQKFVLAMCCIKFSCFEFMRLVEGTKWPQFSLVSHLCTAAGNFPPPQHRNKPISTLYVHQFAYFLCVHMKAGLIYRLSLCAYEGAYTCPVSRSRNTSPSVCRSWLKPKLDSSPPFKDVKVKTSVRQAGFIYNIMCLLHFSNL